MFYPLASKKNYRDVGSVSNAFSFLDLGVYHPVDYAFSSGGPKPKFAFVFFSCAGRLPAAGRRPCVESDGQAWGADCRPFLSV
jgi:hypothetical protein